MYKLVTVQNSEGWVNTRILPNTNLLRFLASRWKIRFVSVVAYGSLPDLCVLVTRANLQYSIWLRQFTVLPTCKKTTLNCNDCLMRHNYHHDQVLVMLVIIFLMKKKFLNEEDLTTT